MEGGRRECKEEKKKEGKRSSRFYTLPASVRGDPASLRGLSSLLAEAPGTGCLQIQVRSDPTRERCRPGTCQGGVSNRILSLPRSPERSQPGWEPDPASRPRHPLLGRSPRRQGASGGTQTRAREELRPELERHDFLAPERGLQNSEPTSQREPQGPRRCGREIEAEPPRERPGAALRPADSP